MADDHDSISFLHHDAHRQTSAVQQAHIPTYRAQRTANTQHLTRAHQPHRGNYASLTGPEGFPHDHIPYSHTVGAATESHHASQDRPRTVYPRHTSRQWRDDVQRSEQLAVGNTGEPQPRPSALIPLLLQPAQPTGPQDFMQDSDSDWMPWSLKHTDLFIFLMFCHIAPYVVLGVLFMLERVHMIAMTSPTYDWVFQFGPTVLAVFVKECLTRLATDHHSVAPFLPGNIVSQHLVSKKLAIFERPKLYALTFWRALLSHTWFDRISHLASLLIVLHSVIISKTTFEVQVDAIVSVAPIDSFSDSIYSSKLPAMMVPSYFVDQSTLTLPWIFGVNRTYAVDAAAVVGVLPFRAEDAIETGDSMSAITSGIAPGFSCEQNLFAEVRMSFVGNASWDINVHMRSLAGCGFNTTYRSVELLANDRLMANGSPNGAVGDNTFAIWTTLGSATDGYALDSSVCERPVTYFLLSGKFDPDDLPDVLDEYATVEAAQDQSWASLACESKYTLFNQSLSHTVTPDGAETSVLAKPDATYVYHSSERGLFDSAMVENFLDTGVIYDLSSIMIGQTFWNTPAPRKMPLTTDIDYLNQNCNPSNASTNMLQFFPNPNSCRMFVNSMLIWDWAFALSIPVTTAYLPAEAWVPTEASVGKSISGWMINIFAVTASILIHLVIIGFLSLSKRIGFRRSSRHPLGQAMKSGLQQDPSPIAAKAILFRESSVRKVLTGVDALREAKAEQTIRKRMVFLRRFFVRSGESGEIDGSPNSSDRNPFIDLHTEALATIKNRGVEEYLNEVEDTDLLTMDDKRLQKMRFAFASWSVRKDSLCITFVLLLGVLTVLIYMTLSHKDYYFWAEGWYRKQSDSILLFWMNQTTLFSVLPVLVLLFFRRWWTSIDEFYRYSQPYVGLCHGLRGAQSICLNYVNDPDLKVTIKACKNGHFRLAFITINTLLIKLALALSGGLFVYSQAVSRGQIPLQQTQIWRTDTFEISSQPFEMDTLRSIILHAMTGTGSFNGGGWQSDVYTMPTVNTTGMTGKFRVRTNALSAELDCQEVPVEFAKEHDNGPHTAYLQDSSCQAVTWPSFCYFYKSQATGGVTASLLLTPGDPEWDDEDDEKASESTTAAFSTSSITSSLASGSLRTDTAAVSSSREASTTTKSSDETTATETSSSFVASISSTVSDPLSSPTTPSGTATSIVSLPTIPPPAPTMPGTTNECYSWFTPVLGNFCWEIAESLSIDWELMRELNPHIDASCSNLQPDMAYCVDGISPSRKLRRTVDAIENRLTVRDAINGTDLFFSLSETPGSCTGWHYINSSTCGDTSDASGSWWIVDAHGAAYTGSYSSDVLGLYNVSSSTSLLCKPKFYNNTVEAVVYVFEENTFYNMSIERVVSSEEIPGDTWAAVKADGSSIPFGEYFSSSLEQFAFTGAFFSMTNEIMLDALSLVAASNSTKSINAFQDVNEFKRISSLAFGRAFSEIINQTTSLNGHTLLTQPVTVADEAPTVSAYEYLVTAHPSPVPLYATMIALVLYAVAIFFAYPDYTHRTALDPSIPMNVAASMYDSSIMQIVQDSIANGRDPMEDLKRLNFGYGVYRGISTGARRLGIDVLERIEQIADPTSRSIFSHHLRRRRPWSNASSIDEKTPNVSNYNTGEHDSDTELAEFVDSPDLESTYTRSRQAPSYMRSNDYDVRPAAYHDSRDFEPVAVAHGPAVMTDYSPTPTDIGVDSSNGDRSIPNRVRNKRWLAGLKAQHKKGQPLFSVKAVRAGPDSDGYASPEGHLNRSSGFLAGLGRWLGLR